ncbi:MAG: phosphodiester glycosidase family protein [Verrucomicrobia bacterium]|nr:phosphodiester glycosidase family protein [Verrucomicrobiota bacterium]MBI3869574.1 phosphodiester glycosidase family protein [Verrucomicrobiota bacterium]
MKTEVKSWVWRRAVAIAIGYLCLYGLRGEATVTISEWNPIFRGIDHAVGHKAPGGGDTRLQYVSMFRIDLQDPDIRFLSTPRIANYVQGSQETASAPVSRYVQDNKVQVAINANFYNPGEVDDIGHPMNVLGLHISQGQLVGPPDPDRYRSSVYISTNNHVAFYPTNWPLANTNGIYTAVTGEYPLIINGVNVANNLTSKVAGRNPRTLIGATKDGRYLFLLVIDGRQDGFWSDGAEDEDSADWLLRLGAYNAINLDGGGSSTMAMEYCPGHAVLLNHPSELLARGRERYVGSHLGVFAKPLSGFIFDVTTEPGLSAAVIAWKTQAPATTQLQYGATTNYGSLTPLDSTLGANHEVTLEGFKPGQTVYFNMLSKADGQTYSNRWCLILGTGDPVPIFGMEKKWKYQTNNLDGVAWTLPGYNDSKWLGEGPGLLYYEDNPNVGPKGTLLPILSTGPTRLPMTYYYRSTFTNPFPVAPISLTFSNYIDDGAVFYLNGVEIQRVRMPAAPAPIQFTTKASSYPCNGDATMDCPVVFTVTGDALTNIVAGPNILAVEVHNYDPGSPDSVFGTALFGVPGDVPVKPPNLSITFDSVAAKVRIAWQGGAGMSLQQTATLGVTASWSAVPSGAASPVVLPVDSATRYFRLHSP